MSLFDLKIVDEDRAEEAAKGGRPLRDLCREEVDNFDQYLKTCGYPEYAHGLAQWERYAIEGYLYQKIRGRIDALDTQNDGSRGESNG